MNSAAEHTCIEFWIEHTCFQFLDYIPRSRIVGSHGDSIFDLLGNILILLKLIFVFVYLQMLYGGMVPSQGHRVRQGKEESQMPTVSL